jgi:2-polyprenyl-3-methyl-5-hydroxy-6-metoxy-1,4-benzoquinol methylase
MLDIIEHLEQPVEVLEACIEKLRAGCVIYLSTGISRQRWRALWTKIEGS